MEDKRHQTHQGGASVELGGTHSQDWGGTHVHHGMRGSVSVQSGAGIGSASNLGQGLAWPPIQGGDWLHLQSRTVTGSVSNPRQRWLGLQSRAAIGSASNPGRRLAPSAIQDSDPLGLQSGARIGLASNPVQRLAGCPIKDSDWLGFKLRIVIGWASNQKQRLAGCSIRDSDWLGLQSGAEILWASPLPPLIS